MINCNMCPRECNVDRDNRTGYCGMNSDIYIARASLHMWEEPCISGEEGSGTVFFTGCTLRCIFCQNRKIAMGGIGKKVSIDELADILLGLQKEGANNINLVTPTHYTRQLVDVIKLAKSRGLTIPIVYNTSGYEKVESLKLLEGLIDIYLPDMKYFSSELSKEYSNAPDYFEVAKKAIAEMVRQVGEPVFNNKGIMEKGVIVRHLVLPDCTEDSKKVIKYLYDTFLDKIFISIMNQYTPLEQVKDNPKLNRKITEKEYDEVVDYAIECGVINGFIQEGETAKESFIPDFEEGKGI